MFIRKNSFCRNKTIWFVYEKSAGNTLPADFHHLWYKDKRIAAKPQDLAEFIYII